LLTIIPAEAKRAKAKPTSAGAKAKSAPEKTAKSAASANASFSAVVIDAGHGGHDRGGIPENLMAEKGVALDVAQRLQKHLEAAGLRTVMTRSDDTFISLGERVRIANAEKDAIFVSVHFNATERAEARGIESYYGSPASAPLAERIRERLLSVTENPDYRPAKHATFWVLRETKLRAVLAECGFLTNPEDTALAQQDEHLEKLATAIAEAVIAYRASLRGT
jgi:N-acetylmuramoyl-L-alanine amidase